MQWVAGIVARPGRPRRSIRLRLTAAYGALFLFSGACLLAITYLLVRGTSSSYCRRGPHDSMTCTIPRGPHGSMTISTSGSGHRHFGVNGIQTRVVARQMGALASAQRNGDLNHLLIYSGLALIIMAVVSVLLGWIVAGRMLRPLRTMTAAAESISASSLDQRLALAGPDDELRHLGQTFNDLLSRLDAAFRAQRDFVANASHELRTPLTWQRTLIQVEMADPDADAESLRRTLDQVLVSGADQEQIIDALLTLTRGQAGLARREPFDLVALTSRAVEGRQADAQEAQVTLRATLGDALVLGDRSLAERLVANLLDNAIRHNTPGGHVEIGTTTASGHAVLSVTNTGPVVPLESVGRLLQPFQRLGTERTSHGAGLGLGLCIVKAIADAHDATLTITPRTQGGLRVQVGFPATDGSAGNEPAAMPTSVDTAS
jgi:signal transduction histidine kinase